MPLDGITTHFLALELNEHLSGARVEKISQPGRFTVKIKLRNRNLSFFLKICADPSDPYITVSSDQDENPSVPPRFCTLLRKYLTGSRIVSVRSEDFERITKIRFRGVNDMGDIVDTELIAEIMGRRSNIILINNESVIIDSLLHIDSSTNRFREVLPAHPYISPPVQENKKLPSEEFDRIFDADHLSGISELFPDKMIISRITGFSPLIAGEIVSRAGIDPGARIRSLNDIAVERLFREIKNVLDDISNNRIKPVIIFSDKDMQTPVDYHALQMTGLPYCREYPDLLTVVEEFYHLKEVIRRNDKRKRDLIRILKKKIESIEGLIEIHKKETDESRDHDSYRLFGDLIYTEMYRLKGGESCLDTTDHTSGDMPMIKIPLDTGLSPSQNAQKYYKTFKKMKARFEIAGDYLRKESSALEYLESVMVSVLNAEDEEDFDAIDSEINDVSLLREAFGKKLDTKNRSLRSSSAHSVNDHKSRPRKYISSDGFEIMIGRNNIQNDELTFRTASKDDIWMHIHLAPGTHTIIRTNGLDIPDKTLEEAAMLTAWFSRKDTARGSKAIVDHCLVKYVTKQKHSQPGHVFYRNHSSLTVYPCVPPGVVSSSEIIFAPH